MKKKLSMLLAFVLVLSGMNFTYFTVEAAGYEFDTYFDAKGGDPEPDTQTIPSDKDTIDEPAKPSKDGYAFMDWQVKGTNHFIDFSKMVRCVGNESVEYYAKDGNKYSTMNNYLNLEAVYFKKEPLKVVFNTDGGTPVPDPQAVNPGEKLQKPEDPVKEGYVFQYWSTKQIGDNYKKYQLDFDSLVHYVYNTSAQKIYNGIGFNSEEGYLGNYTAVDSELELIAIYEEKSEESEKKTYKVTFDTDGGLPLLAEQIVEDGGAPQDVENPKKDGYTFEYWAFEDGQGAPAFNLWEVHEDIKVKAIYKKIDKKVEKEKVTVNFDTRGGSPEPSAQELELGEKVVEPNAKPSKEGYEFLAWYDAEGKYDFNKPVERQMILYAMYKKVGESHDKSKRKDIDIDDKDYDKAIMNFKGAFFTGYPDNTFKPEGTITRAEMATVFARILGLENKAVTTNKKFSDIDGHWAKDNILRVAEYGLINGYPDGKFDPNGKMKRGEIASIINKYWKIKGFEPKREDANVSDISEHWAKKLILALYNHRFVDLYEGHKFYPDAPLKRADVAQILNRITDRPLKSDGMQKFTDVPKTYWAFKEVNTASTALE